MENLVMTQRGREAAAADLVARAEVRRVTALAELRTEDQADLGQFFTPARAAILLASMADLPSQGNLRVLDPGAGSGSLTAALVARVLREAPQLVLDLVAVELDGPVLPHLRATLDDIEETCVNVGVRVVTTLLTGDFVALRTDPFAGPVAALEEPFDVILMNPPYKKLNVRNAARRALVAYGVDCSNIYAAFMALGMDLLNSGGQLVSITPRSFANGPYFNQFRGYLLANAAITRLHVFESRSTVFSDTGVLQENVIMTAVRGGSRGKVTLSVSVGHTDEPVTRLVEHDEVVHPDDPHKFVRILSTDVEAEMAERVARLPCTLEDLGIQVSTGRVVDFRSRPCLVEARVKDSVPLIYPANLREGVVEWPRDIRKAQGFKPLEPKDVKLLLPPGTYVVVKRFSAKEERRRVVAAVWRHGQSSDPVALENHLNYYHVKNTGLDEALAIGLSFWLNSSLVDGFFRTFSGHTQVNATDLKTMRYPTVAALRSIGEGRSATLPVQEVIDLLVSHALTALQDVA